MGSLEEHGGFWRGRGLYGPPPPPPLLDHALQQQGPQGPVATSQNTWLDRAERTAAACRAWVALAGDLVGLVFKLLVLVAFAWCLWTGPRVAADGKAA